MKGNVRIIECLNGLLADELTAISQYMVHSELCANWGFEKLHQATEKRAVTEMHHAEKLIGRIVFLEGQPTVSRLNQIHIGADVPAQLDNDMAAEQGAVAAYNAGIQLAGEVNDHGSWDLMSSILNDEEEHLDFLEIQHDLIRQIGLQNYLLNQANG